MAETAKSEAPAAVEEAPAAKKAKTEEPSAGAAEVDVAAVGKVSIKGSWQGVG